MAVAATVQLLLECTINFKILMWGGVFFSLLVLQVYILSLTIALHLNLLKYGQQKKTTKKPKHLRTVFFIRPISVSKMPSNL